MKYNWAIIGYGHIANEMAIALNETGGHFYAVSGRNTDKAEAFAEKYNIEKIYSSVDEMLSDEKVDIVYIATPHNTHIEFLRKALKVNKHVLCEKAITLNSDELSEAVTLAKERNLILAEAMTIFHCPVYDKVFEIINSGKLGKLKTIQVNLGSFKEYDMTNRFFNMELAGGAMLDIGVYALSFMRYFMASCPDDIMSQMVKAPTGADEQVNIILKNKENEMATVTLSLVSKLPKLAIAAYENGYVSFDNYNRTNRAEITYTEDGRTEVIETADKFSPLAYEVIDMEDAVDGKSNKMQLSLTTDVMKIMTKVRYKHQMYYPEEA